ncbi:elongation factor Tu, mitochondrial-like protein [Tanacetum coccineum]
MNKDGSATIAFGDGGETVFDKKECYRYGGISVVVVGYGGDPFGVVDFMVVTKAKIVGFGDNGIWVAEGRGTVVATGRVEQGMIKVGEEIEIMGLMQVNSLCLLNLFI